MKVRSIFIQKIYSESGYEKFLMDGTEEGEMRNGSYRIGYDKRSNFDKIYEQFREQKR